MATAAKHAAKPAPKTRAPKAATKPVPAELQQLAPTALTTVPYGRLKRAPQNVRKTNIAADVESLAEDIAAHGLLQSLIGYAGSTKIDAQAVYVVGGGRRLQSIADRCLRLQAERVLAQAERDLPSVAGYVIPADLLIGGKVDVPSGCVTVASGWDGKLGMNVDIDECWKRAIAASVPIHIEIGIARDEPIGDDDDGSPLGYVARRGRSRFFVPRDAAAKVLPKREPVNYGGGKVLTDEERREQELEREARLWAARLSVPRFSDIPGFEGRVFYEQDWLDNHRHRPGDPKTGPRTPSFELRVFVTEDEIAANMDAGRAAAIEQRERIERFKAEQAAAREQAEQEKEARWKELCALDPAPEVLLDERGDLWVKTDQGWTVAGEEDEVGYAEEFTNLLEQFGPGDITEWWATRADYDQAHPVGAPDEEVGS